MLLFRNLTLSNNSISKIIYNLDQKNKESNKAFFFGYSLELNAFISSKILK